MIALLWKQRENYKFKLWSKTNVFHLKYSKQVLLHLERVGLTNKSSAVWFTFLLFGETGIATEQMSAACQIKTVFIFYETVNMFESIHISLYNLAVAQSLSKLFD